MSYRDVCEENPMTRCSLGACIIKPITATINSVACKASVFVKASIKWLKITKALAYCTTDLIAYVKKYNIQAFGL